MDPPTVVLLAPTSRRRRRHLTGDGAADVPDPRVPDHQVRLFLRHLWATDGTIGINSVGQGTTSACPTATSARLADDVQRLLLRVGVQARISVVAPGRPPSVAQCVDG